MAEIDGISGFNAFVYKHGANLKSSGVPEYFWHQLYQKLKSSTFDAGDMFMIAQFEEGGRTVIVNKEGGCICSDPMNIFLIDHCWTFEIQDAPIQLRSVPGLLQRMVSMMGVSDDLSESEQIDEVFKVMWKYIRTYSRIIRPNEPPTTYWYAMDEFGSAISHSSLPNFRIVPFFYEPEELAYNLLFPIKDVGENEEITIDYVEGASKEQTEAREALLVPWTGQKFIDMDSKQDEADESYFVSGTIKETLPTIQLEMPLQPAILKVFSEYSFVREYLKDPGFAIVDSEDEADILWLTKHFYNFKELSEQRPGTFINQFPCERVLTTKDLLSIIARRSSTFSDWLPMTYNLITELPKFVGLFQRRETENLDNHWICKPWNMARAIDTTVTNNLNCLLRLPFSGPKIVQKYVEDPVLYNRPNVGLVKFDVRYVVLLESLEPLKLHVYKDFFLRFANKPFELKNLWDYDMHFTVMNYRNESELHHVKSEEFVDNFAAQYPNHTWKESEEKILHALREVFIAASLKPPPRGLANFTQSRALYAADLILTWNKGVMQPLLLEINFGPDCERACLYYPEFYDDVFLLLFKGQCNKEKFHTL